MDNLLLILFTLVKITLLQLLGVFGIFFLLGYILSFLQNATHRNYQNTIGWKGIIWTAWFGTPIHELGHVFFAKIFFHKINSVRIFEPNRETGGLGHVDHSYNKQNVYQSIGNFFIGAAPMIWGGIILAFVVYFLLPNGKEILTPSMSETLAFGTVIPTIKNIFLGLFTFENITSWNFWLFLYISFCIASHMAPSKQDRIGMWKGFVWIVILLLIINIFALLLKQDPTTYILKMGQYLSIFTTIFIYAAVISLCHLIISEIFLWPFQKLGGR
ncbi:MAG: hypothetical protein COX81_00760 [Candidatus Magasanikbacteria bacterium CG_4_10_14_0_2_um_filter_37_12]|uniref:Uncharacterized protein n=1 Tax=Candidatus Magasanikbacteria bacterium CG_4_10_14_0_2_um_filter_37_12 TaxID=1974637 RepID=A0A2M7V9L1_9BACT|nr:MAG: hypothetical protein COX81_00760 [Candidatus Magasanikbacteria bacterium CG_4_10_14_0_2_um_filter_37_12]